MVMTAPPPLQGGSRVRCPMIDMPAMEEGHGFVMCGWSRKAGRKTLARYRRHWRRAHLSPFLAETRALTWTVEGSTPAVRQFVAGALGWPDVNHGSPAPRRRSDPSTPGEGSRDFPGGGPRGSLRW